MVLANKIEPRGQARFQIDLNNFKIDRNL
jgi:hypothetical protein